MKQPNTKSSTSKLSQEMKEYIVMENLFERHGIESEENTRETPKRGKAKVRSFSVTRTKDDSVLSLVIYFHMPTDEYGKYTTDYDARSPSSELEYILQGSFDLSELLGKSFSVSRNEEEDKWDFRRTDATISKAGRLPDHSTEKLKTMNERFKRFSVKFNSASNGGDADIVDYYVRESATNITQDLEIGIKFELPDGTTEFFECIHDKDHPDENLEYIFEYINPDSLFDLPKYSIPVEYDREEQTWELQVPFTHENKIIELISRHIFSASRPVPITKTYKHADERKTATKQTTGKLKTEFRESLELS